MIHELNIGGGEPVLSWAVLEKFEQRNVLGKFGIQIMYVFSKEWEISFMFFASRCVYFLYIYMILYL